MSILFGTEKLLKEVGEREKPYVLGSGCKWSDDE